MSRGIFRRQLVAGARNPASPAATRGTALPLIRAAAPGLLLLTLAACSAGPMGGISDNAAGPGGPAAQGNIDLATQQACRQRVNDMYEVRDRGDIYAANPTVNSPFSANYQPDVPSRGLSNQFAYDQSLAECEHNSANGAEGPTFPPAPPPVTTGH
jgi:hypothetical protein